MENQIYFPRPVGPLFIVINTTDYNGPEHGCGVIPFAPGDAALYGCDDIDLLDMLVGEVVESDDFAGAYVMRIA